MGKHQTAISEEEPRFMIHQSAIGVDEENSAFRKLKPMLAELRRENKLSGYILKSSTQAIVDLDNPKEIVEFSLFATQLLNTSQRLLGTCNHEQTKSVFFEGTKMKVLCMKISGNQLNVFMEKSASHERILEKFASMLK